MERVTRMPESTLNGPKTRDLLAVSEGDRVVEAFQGRSAAARFGWCKHEQDERHQDEEEHSVTGRHFDGLERIHASSKSLR